MVGFVVSVGNGGVREVRIGRDGCGRRRGDVVMGLFGSDPETERRKNEAFLKQQEMLERRKQKEKSEEYYMKVEARRKEVDARMKARSLNVEPGEDPLVDWKRRKEEGLMSPLGYEEEDEGGIAIPMASFGIPRFDNGERFDLRLPYADQGYVSDDADIMSKIRNWFGKKDKPKDGA